MTSTGDLWKRQRRLMSPFYTPRGVQEFVDIFLRDTVTMTQRWDDLASKGAPVEMFDEMALITASIVLKAIFSTESAEDILDEFGSLVPRSFKTLPEKKASQTPPAPSLHHHLTSFSCSWLCPHLPPSFLINP